MPAKRTDVPIRDRAIASLITGAAWSGRIGGRPLGSLAGTFLNAAAGAMPGRTALIAIAAQQGTLLLATSQARPAARALARRIGRSRRVDVARMGHTLLLRLGELDSATRVSSRLEPRVTSATNRFLKSSEEMARGATHAALEALGPAVKDDAACRGLRLMLLRSLGRMDRILECADPGLIGAASTAAHRFDALWDLGQVDDAIAAIDEALTVDLRSVDTLRRARDGHRFVAGLDAPALLRFVKQVQADAKAPGDWYTTVLFEFDEIPRLAELSRDRLFMASLGSTGIYQIARALYITRDFDAARSLLRPLRSTGRRWDAEKLLARIELELGISESTVRSRARFRRPGEGFDEVEYLGLHQLGHHEEAFSRFLPDEDHRRLTGVFGSRAELVPGGGAGSRFVIPQGGPGDEILMAAAYTDLARRADRTDAACDPRLQSLFERSFPEINFHPCDRRASRSSPGFLAPGRPARPDHVMFEQLDVGVDEVAQNCDRVILSRSLGSLVSSRAPFEAYLRPRPDLVDALSERVRGGIGVVWRSEFYDAVRSIHYLRPEDLVLLGELGQPIVCLQHDARPSEQAALASAMGTDVRFLDDFDLRNDFEAMAAVASGLDAVVGIGTTFIELAGAVGTTTVALHPTRVGVWRRCDGGHDYWHQSMRAAFSPDLEDRSKVVGEAVRILRASVAPGA